MTSQPIRLETNFINLITILTFAELREVSMEHLHRFVIPTGNTSLSRHLVPSLLWDLHMLLLLRPLFPKSVVIFSIFSLRIYLGSISIFFWSIYWKYARIYNQIFIWSDEMMLFWEAILSRFMDLNSVSVNSFFFYLTMVSQITLWSRALLEVSCFFLYHNI